jgi:hypothetical protein
MASKRAQRRQCHRKVSYPSRDAAFAALRRLRPDVAYRMQVYPCPLARHYHLGHMTRQSQIFLTLQARHAV